EAIMAKKAKKAKSKTKKRKSGKKAAPARKKKRVVAKKSAAKKAKPKAKAAAKPAAPKPAPAPSPAPSYTPPPAWPPMGGTSGGGSGSGGGTSSYPPPRQSAGLTIVPVGSFSSREREPIASPPVARSGERLTHLGQASRRHRGRQCHGDPDCVEMAGRIALRREKDERSRSSTPRGGGSLCRRLTTS